MIKVGGLVPFSTIDFPDHLSAVIFCQGCQWRCTYCHNTHLMEFSKGQIEWDSVQIFLNSRKGLLDGVVFSGGEPILQTDIVEAIAYVKSEGFKVGIHTTGCCTKQFIAILPYLDWVGFDIKAPINIYDRITGKKNSAKQIFDSVKKLLESEVPYQFRTTFDKRILREQDLQDIKCWIRDVGGDLKNYVVQSCR